MFNKKIVYLIILIFVSCIDQDDNEHLEENAYDIINLTLKIIENRTNPPIPPNWNKDSIKKIDYKKNKKFAIVPETFGIYQNERIKRSIGKEYNLFFSEEARIFSQNIKKKNITFLSNNSLSIKAFKKNSLKNRKVWKKFDLIINFSEIRFNTMMDKAIIIFSVEYYKNNGYSILLKLKKENGTWQIHSSDLLNLS